MKEKEKGYLLLSTLFLICIFSTLFLVYNQVLITKKIREKEKELKFNMVSLQRGINLYRRDKGYFPENLEILFELKLIRKKYRNPFRIGSSIEWVEDWNYDRTKGIVKALSEQKGLNGKKYSTWQIDYKENKYNLIFVNLEEQKIFKEAL